MDEHCPNKPGEHRKWGGTWWSSRPFRGQASSGNSSRTTGLFELFKRFALLVVRFDSVLRAGPRPVLERWLLWGIEMWSFLLD